jgi:hypothetical protein
MPFFAVQSIGHLSQFATRQFNSERLPSHLNYTRWGIRVGAPPEERQMRRDPA